eukprot:gb/GECG01016739.1/.p1 GENE.gb/GECG01016739.1/~~gb/GECG01016739.1/.p1  ORF type:complete len:201 (+),score=13.00 gb/GECG01016739.1/:1-603(+)
MGSEPEREVRCKSLPVYGESYGVLSDPAKFEDELPIYEEGGRRPKSVQLRKSLSVDNTSRDQAKSLRPLKRMPSSGRSSPIFSLSDSSTAEQTARSPFEGMIRSYDTSQLPTYRSADADLPARDSSARSWKSPRSNHSLYALSSVPSLSTARTECAERRSNHRRNANATTNKPGPMKWLCCRSVSTNPSQVVPQTDKHKS